MENHLKIELNPQSITTSDCEKVILEVFNPTDEIEVKLSEIDDKIADLDISIDNLTNHADKFDYAVAVASGILTGMIDVLFVGKTNINIEEVQKELEEKFHTANDSAYKHKIIKHDGNEGWVSSSQYHRLEDLAHHPTLVGLFAAIMVRFFRVTLFSNSSNKKTTIFFIDKNENADTFKAEIKDMCVAWALASLTGTMVWMSHIAMTNEVVDKNIPVPIRKLVSLLSTAPAIIELMVTADTWIEHIMSDVSTPAGVPGFFLSTLKEISMIPIINKKTKLPAIVDDLYSNKTMNMWAYSGIVFSAVKNQTIPVLINEVLVRSFYFIRHLIVEYKENNGFENINWHNTLPFGNRTIERMMTIATGTFTAIDTLDAVIEGAISGVKAGAGFWAEFGRQVVLRLNFVGIGRFTVALGTEAVMGFKKGKKTKERMKLKNQSLYLMKAKIYYGNSLMWSAVEDTNESIDTLFETMETLSIQISENISKVQNSIIEIDKLDFEAAKKNNQGLVDDILDVL